MKHIVVLGAGTGGMPAAYELRNKIGAEHRTQWSMPVRFFSSFHPIPGWRWDGANVTRPRLRSGRIWRERASRLSRSQSVRSTSRAAKLTLANGEQLSHDDLVNTDLRRRKLRNKVPMTFVTSAPYVGHMGLGGVGDSKTMLESAFRNHDIKWITNCRSSSRR